MSLIEEIKFIIKKDKIKYDDLKVLKLVALYKNRRQDRVLDLIRINCYPIILACLSKFFNRRKYLRIDFEDLFCESIFIVDNCVKGYSFDKQTQFITYLWISLYRRYNRYYLEEFKTSCVIDNKKIFSVIEDLDKENQGLRMAEDYNISVNNVILKDLESLKKINEIDFKMVRENLLVTLKRKEKMVLFYLITGKTKLFIKNKMKITESHLRNILYKISLLIKS